MSAPSAELARAVTNRMQELGLSHRAAAETTAALDPQGKGLSTRTITSVVSGERVQLHPRTQGILDHFLGWPPGGVSRVLAGHPAPESHVAPLDIGERVTALEEELADLKARINALQVTVTI